MKITLWRQFSSNHSASFMVVGKFESVEWAETVAEELRTMLSETSAWWSQYENYDEITLVENRVRKDGGLTPPEKKYAEQFQIEKWGKGRQGVLDWVQSKDAPDAVSVFENLVIINQGRLNTDTWAGATPFDEILRKLGGKVAVNCEQLDAYFAMNLTCNAPDEDTALKIMSEAKLKQHNDNNMIILPGLYPTRGTMQVDETIITLREYQFFDFFYRPVSLLSQAEKKQMNLSAKQRDVKSSFEEELQRVLEYLKAHGCTNIEYEFVEVPFPKRKS
jgi:hypothetical protein